MNINKIISDAFKDSGITVLYANRGDIKSFPLIVFHVMPEIIEQYDEGYIEKYVVYMNLYCALDKVQELRDKIISIMKQNGFRLQQFGNAETFNDKLNVAMINIPFYIITEKKY